MGKYTVHLKIELEDDHGVPFSKDLFKYVLAQDLMEGGALNDAYCLQSVDIEGIEGLGEIQPISRIQ